MDNEKMEFLSNLKEKMESSSEQVMVEIYKIVKKNNSDHTVNKNGVFFDLRNLDDFVIEEIDAYLGGVLE